MNSHSVKANWHGVKTNWQQRTTQSVQRPSLDAMHMCRRYTLPHPSKRGYISDTILCMAKYFLEGGARHDQVKWQKIHDNSLAKRMIIYCDAAHFAKLKPDERKGVINRKQMNASERAALHALVLVFNRVTENTGHPREIEILLAEPNAPVQEIHSDTSIHDKKLLRNATTLLNDCEEQKGTRVMTTGFEG